MIGIALMGAAMLVEEQYGCVCMGMGMIELAYVEYERR